MQTFVPKRYQSTEQDIELLAAAIIDLFEDLDADCDGQVTWQDFCTYYEQGTAENEEVANEVPKFTTVFRNIQGSSDQQSGKTGKIIVEPLVDNGGLVQEIEGSRIIQLDAIGEQFFMTTDAAVYLMDSSFLFPRKLFEPKINVVLNYEYKKENAKGQEQRLKDAQKVVEVLFKANNQQVPEDVRRMVIQEEDDKALQQEHDNQRKKELKDIKHSVQPTVANCSRIVQALYLQNLGVCAVCMEYPGIFFVNTSGQVSRFYPVESMVTALFYDSEGSSLYIGFQNGRITQLQIQQHKIFKQEDVGEKETSKQMEMLAQIMKEKNITDVQQLGIEDLIKIYPELQSCVIPKFDKAGDIVQQIQIKKENQKKEVKKVLALNEDDLRVNELQTSIIFDMTQSAIKASHIEGGEEAIILSDPKAFLDVKAKSSAQQSLLEKKHGSVELKLDIKQIRGEFFTEGAVKCIAGGRGRWENLLGPEVFRIVTADSTGSLTIIGNDFEVIASFPLLHSDGIVDVHVVGDYISSIGFNEVYLIDEEAIRHAHEGLVIIENKVKGCTNKDLIEGNLVTSQSHIKILQPPRPGQPIVSSFLFGNVVGCVDHESFLTMFHAVTGVHLTRVSCNFPNLMLNRFGLCSYNFQKDLGYLPIGKYVYCVKAVPNELIQEDEAIMDVLQLQALEKNMEKQTLSIPIGSINKEVFNYCVNQTQNEIAVVTGDLEVTFYSLRTGRPNRILSLSSYKDDHKQGHFTEYNAIESGDSIQMLSEAVKFQKPKSTSNIKNVPQVLQTHNILELLGNKVLGINIDVKGRILFVFGVKGIACFYWQSGKQFNINTVGIVGVAEEKRESGVIDNPFNVKQSMLEKRVDVDNRWKKSEGNISDFTLNIDFDILIKGLTSANNLAHKQREILLYNDKLFKRIYLNDTLNPKIVFCITTSASAEYADTPVNTRVIKTFEIEPVRANTRFVDLFMKNAEYFKSSQSFMGLIDNSNGYKYVSYFVPKQMKNEKRSNEYNIVDNSLRRLITFVTGQCEKEDVCVTCIAASSQLGLVAIGSSQGQIYLFDTTSNYLPKGVITHPYMISIPSISMMTFCGAFPLLISGNTNGDIFMHTVPPYQQTLRMICCFRHSTYMPTNKPLNKDYLITLQKLTNYAMQVTNTVVNKPRKSYIMKKKQEEFITYILLSAQPDLKMTKFLQNAPMTNDIEKFLRTTQNIEVSTTASVSTKQSTMGYQTQKNESKLREIETIDSEVFIGGPHQMMNISMHKITSPQQEVKDKDEQQADFTKELEIFKDFLSVFRTTSSTAQSGLMDSSASSKSSKKRQKLYKIQAAIHLMSIVSNTSKLIRNANHMSVIIAKYEIKKEVTEQKLKIDKNIQEKAEQQSKIAMDKTDQFLKDKQKQTMKNRKLERPTFATPNVDDFSYDTGYVNKIVSRESGLTKVPLRVADLVCLKTTANPTCCYFDNDTYSLIIGDEYGFVTRYNFKQVFADIKAKEVVRKVKSMMSQLQEGIVDDGLEFQYLVHNAAVDDTIQPIHAAPRVDYIFRAHKQSVAHVEKLMGSKTLLTYGNDKRLFCFDIDTAGLKGFIQRVLLNPPSNYIQQYFQQDVRCIDTLKVEKRRFTNRTQNLQLLLNDLEDDQRNNQPPPFRLEYPPACAYPWIHEPVDLLRDQSSMKSCDMLSSTMGIQNPIGDVTQKLSSKQPVPSYEDDAAQALLKATGLTPGRVREHRHSWTVRAIVGRATNWKIDSSQSNAEEVIQCFATPQRIQGPKSARVMSIMEDDDEEVLKKEIEKM